MTRAWGGLERLRGYQPTAPEHERIGESWDIASYPGADCRMLNGPMAGLPLSDLLARDGKAVLGRPWRGFNDFPLLHKYLAPVRDLPLQVHPGDAYARRVEGQNGKAECWVILDCAPDASILLGLDNVDNAEHLRRIVAAGTLARHARRVPVRNGDVVPIPAGIVHSLGHGVLAYEVQQNSDVTYRLDDFGLGIDSPEERQLHLRRALDVIDLPANLAPTPPFANWMRPATGVLDFAPHFRAGGAPRRRRPADGSAARRGPLPRARAVLDGRRARSPGPPAPTTVAQGAGLAAARRRAGAARPPSGDLRLLVVRVSRTTAVATQPDARAERRPRRGDVPGLSTTGPPISVRPKRHRRTLPSAGTASPPSTMSAWTSPTASS